ncbi:hypothetical protein VR7878_00847 [Vibrio ruber DSM 16370]|uniref:DUF2946 domain-containing protein n=2 Tax=Vibrio ruber TaxID=184755 RepID=A0A1R4LDV8_VIBR1|nr:DUF2946 domain-containing protein [Vibrio ruber]SJN54609.1 hypothetical protein VR7878_00847 [Vibrio ruber DSM 16370]
MAWFGLFAMLIIYIAPLLSQTIMISQAAVISKTAVISKAAGMPKTVAVQSASHHHKHFSQPLATYPTTVTHQDAHTLHHAWCGYCSLLLHMSGLAQTSLQLVSHHAVLVWIYVTIQPFLFRCGWCKNQLPRAPPITLLHSSI